MNAVFAKPKDYATSRAAVGPRAAPDVVTCGTQLTIRRGILVSNIWIVVEEEAGSMRDRVAATSPLGRALLGARLGDVVEYESGGRVEEIRVLAIAADAR